MCLSFVLPWDWQQCAASGGEIWLRLTGMICPWAGNLIAEFLKKVKSPLHALPPPPPPDGITLIGALVILEYWLNASSALRFTEFSFLLCDAIFCIKRLAPSKNTRSKVLLTKEGKKKKIKKHWTSLKIKLLVWAKLSNNSILTDKGKNLFPKNLPGHRIIGWKSEDESHIIENFACNSTSWKSSAKPWVFKGLFELFVGEPETHFYREKFLSLSFSNDRLLLKLNTHSQRFVKNDLLFFFFREKTGSFSKNYFLELSMPVTKIISFVSVS